MKAQCACGALSLTLPGPSSLVAVCHCEACQRRTGSVFGMGAYYPPEAVQVSGAVKLFSRTGASGGRLTFRFCPECGSTVFWTATVYPDLTGVAVGAIADPDYPPPSHSIHERSKHTWVSIDCATEHRPGGLNG